MGMGINCDLDSLGMSLRAVAKVDAIVEKNPSLKPRYLKLLEETMETERERQGETFIIEILGPDPLLDYQS